MLNRIKAILKNTNIETSRSTKTTIKGCKNLNTRGIKIKKDKYEDNEVLIYYTKLDQKEIESIANILQSNGYNTETVPGIIIVRE